jgi:hypothetical protein
VINISGLRVSAKTVAGQFRVPEMNCHRKESCIRSQKWPESPQFYQGYPPERAAMQLHDIDFLIQTILPARHADYVDITGMTVRQREAIVRICQDVTEAGYHGGKVLPNRWCLSEDMQVLLQVLAREQKTLVPALGQISGITGLRLF